MNSGNPHLLKLTIADLNALTVHAEQSLFCGSILEHINTLDRNHRVPQIVSECQHYHRRDAVSSQKSVRFWQSTSHRTVHQQL